MPPTTLTSAQALERLMEGNRRFVADSPAPAPSHTARRQALAAGQAPFVALLGCSDSRVPPETLFGTGLGEVFDVRVAGNGLSTAGLGSLEYASGALAVPLILVLGHERCGAVTAAIEVMERGVILSGALMEMVAPILPAVAEARRGNPDDLLDATVRLHARRTARHLGGQAPSLAPRIASGALQVMAAHYDLDEGRVTLLDA